MDGLDHRFMDIFPKDMYMGHAILFPPKFMRLVLLEARRMGIIVDPVASFVWQIVITVVSHPV